jgi:hypothetical protein
MEYLLKTSEILEILRVCIGVAAYTNIPIIGGGFTN